jgi:uncharacterized protein
MEMTKYEPGTPSWVDIGVHDIPAAIEFYGKVFGWKAEDQGPDSGGYQMFTLRGKSVAGLGPAQNPGPPYWTSYVTVSDLDETLLQVEKEGGAVIMPGMDVLTAGRMGIAADPTGAVFAMWQPGEHIGAQLVNEHGTLCWNELSTRDTEKAKAFYTALGWNAQTDSEMGMEYTQFMVGDRSVAGMMAMNPDMPAEVPSHWMVYFAVDDADAAVERIKAAGGNTVTDLMDISVGRFAVVTDNQGAPFAVIKLTEAS